jgi:hypothetical protein
VELAQYAWNNGIIDKAAFVWWAPGLLKKMNCLIQLSKCCHIQKGYKFGIGLLINIEEALLLDER